MSVEEIGREHEGRPAGGATPPDPRPTTDTDVVALDQGDGEDLPGDGRRRGPSPRQVRWVAVAATLAVGVGAVGEWRERAGERAARAVVDVSVEPGAGRSYATFRFDGSGDVTLRARVSNHGPRPVQITAVTVAAPGYRAQGLRGPVTVAPADTAAVSVRLVQDCASFRAQPPEEVSATVRPTGGPDVVVQLPGAATGYLTSLARGLCGRTGPDWAPARGQAPGYTGG